ncbi:MAG: Gfo/Idh/MocA family oxidoreductase [Saprospiraceae bacterium]|nr:Gfo/Idh/MocA family oxidoreductase [Saprospiraceae bacterium]MBK9680875.1 Gfo/Idh/MocA family oxidoreductase [Saprospiraceae bacterium]
MMDTPLYKYILVGCGAIAPRHIREILRTGTLTAVCDTDPERLSEYMTMYHIPGYASFDTLMSAGLTADIVVLCTPNGYHASQSIQAMQQGYHVICEKPMALKSKDAALMLAVAKQTNKSLSIVKQNRFNGPILQLQQWIASGASGQVYSLSMNCLWNRDTHYYTSSTWRGTKELDGGILYTQFSHYIDFLYWIFGEVIEIKSLASNVCHREIIDFDDQGVAILRFESGVLGTIHYSINAFEKNMESSLTVLAEHGSIRIGGLSANTIEYQHKSGSAFSIPDTTTHINQYPNYAGSVSNHHFVYDQVLNGLQSNVYNVQSAYEAMKTVELIERIYALSPLPTGQAGFGGS